MNVRKLEGLEVEAPRTLKELDGVNLSDVAILISKNPEVHVFVDLAQGQKTGFFMDQSMNIHTFKSFIANTKFNQTVRIIDLCCYVGQWATYLSQQLTSQGYKVEVLLVDGSQDALDFATRNVLSNSPSELVKVETLKGDVLKVLDTLAPDSFDIVICDPPAFIKNRKDIHAGEHAYLKLNESSMKLLKPKGFIASCSCSALLEEESMIAMLSKASRRANKSIQWIAKGSQAVDHPVLSEFPEGRYLKSWFGIYNFS